jgi:hypothetical protein
MLMDESLAPSGRVLRLHQTEPDRAQSKRFMDMAREVEAEDSKEGFEKAFKKIATLLTPRL